MRPLGCRLPTSLAWSLLYLTSLGVAASRAQSPDSELAPDYAPPPHVEPLAFPDIPDEVLDAQKIDHPDFSLHWGLAILGDSTSFSQDAASLAQVGRQPDKAEFRSFRFIVRGDLRFLGPWNYFLSAEYKGFGQNTGADNWAFGDIRLSRPLWGDFAKLTLGKQKEAFAYEMVGDAANLPHQERLLSPFFQSRNWGVSVSDAILDRRATWSVGLFNDWLIDGADFATSGTQAAARFTALPIWEDNGRRYLHLATSVRYNGGDQDTLRFRGRPETNVADYYLDTGNLTADHAWELGLEALWNEGPLSLLAEYIRADVSSPASGDPAFSGWYLTGSWVITGETRPYDRNVAYARRVLPTKRWGAPELVVRVGRVDLDDASVTGGSLNQTYLGLNWWATKRWKLGFGWGHTQLDRDDRKGHTDRFHLRLQWIR